MRVTAIAAAISIAFVGLVSADEARAVIRKTTHIAEQKLGPALRELAKEHRFQVLFRSDLVRGQRTAGAAGELTTDEALQQLLSGTALTFQYLDERTVTIVPLAEVGSRDAGGPGTAGETSATQPADDVTSTPRQRSFLDRFRLSQADTARTPPPQAEESAANENETLEEITVTAQKRAERAIDVPISITALDGKRLEEFRIRDTQDLSYFVPSLTVTEVGPGMGHIAIRGLGSERGNSSLTGIYIDEAAVAASPVFPIEPAPVDLERVEVLKGPQGTLYGEGSTGGTIRYITRAPDLSGFSARGELAVYDTEDGGVGEELIAVLNAPLVQEKLGVRLAGYLENGSGWIDRPATSSEDINDNELMDIRTRVLWKPVDALDINGTVIIHRNDAGAQNVVNLEPRSQSNFLTEVDPTTPTDVQDDYDLYSLTVRYNFGTVSLLSASSYVEMSKLIQGQSQGALIDLPFPPFDGIVPFGSLARNWAEDLKVFSQELRLASNGDERLQWTVGGFYRDSEVMRSRLVDSVLGSTLGPLPSADDNSGFDGSESWAAFGDASFDLTDRLTLGTGLRYFHDDRESQAPAAAGLPISSGPLAQGSFDNLSSRVYASYALTSDANVYLSRSEGFRSGGFNDSRSVAEGAPADFDPEVLVAYEFGTKLSLLGGRLYGELAVFFNEFTDIQYLGVVPGGLSFSYTSNVGEAEMKGFDWSLRWRATDQLTLGFSGDVIDTEVTKLRATGTAQNVGDPIDFVSDYTLSFTADYGFRWVDGVPGLFRAAYNQKGPSFQTLRGIGLVNFQDKSATVNFLSAEIGAVFGGVTVGLFGSNLLDEEEKLRPGISAWTAQARPRTFGLRVSAEF